MARLPDIASWAFSRALPGAVLDLKRLQIASFQHIVAGKLVIRDQKSGEELLKMSGATVSFSLKKLMKLKFSEVQFFEPVVSISPSLIELLSSSKSKKKSAFPIEIDRVLCKEGDIRIFGMGEKIPELNAKFWFDFSNLTKSSEIRQNIILWAISAKLSSSTSPLLELHRMEVIFTLNDLLQSRLEQIQVQGGKLIVGEQLRCLIDNSKIQAVHAASGGGSIAMQQTKTLPIPAWMVNTLDIFRVHVALEEKDPRMSQIHFELTTQLKSITLGDAANNLGSTLQTVQLSNINLYAPQPSAQKVMSFHTIFVRFTLQDLLQEQIQEVVVLYPTIYLNEDLFAYMDSIAQSGAAVVPSSSPNIPGWMIRRLRIDFGNLIIGANENDMGLPVKFETDVRDISLRNLAALKINTQLRIPEEKYEFASYQLEFKSKSGEMHFAYPPENGTNNVVAVLKLSHLRWKQYNLQEPWIGVTFDHNGINGKFGGKAYKGYVTGGFTFFFGNNSLWSAWVAARNIDLYQLTKVISPENFIMTGPLNFSVQLNALGSDIERLKGSFQVDAPGKMHVGKIENLLQKLPTDWPALKRNATTITLKTLQDFEYKTALGNFWFVDSQGIFNLNLSGPTGSRKFEFVVHTNSHPSSFWNASATTLQ